MDRGKALKATRSAIDLVSSEPCRHSLLEFMGYLENEQAIPARRIHDIVRKVASLRETFSMETNTPVDKLFCYSIAETMKHKAAQPSYVGKVMQNALMRYRDGALKF